MKRVTRYDLHDLVGMIADTNNRLGCRHLLQENESLFKQANGSTHNHQNWSGGYYDHVTEVMNRAVWLYTSNPRPNSFSLSDALVVLFLHDIEKPWKYYKSCSGEYRVREEFNTEEKSHTFRNEKIKEYGIRLTSDQENALKYVHGEGNDYSSKRRVMTPLAAFCHICDIWVARIDFNYPLSENDPWEGARRVNQRR